MQATRKSINTFAQGSTCQNQSAHRPRTGLKHHGRQAVKGCPGRHDIINQGYRTPPDCSAAPIQPFSAGKALKAPSLLLGGRLAGAEQDIGTARQMQCAPQMTGHFSRRIKPALKQRGATGRNRQQHCIVRQCRRAGAHLMCQKGRQQASHQKPALALQLMNQQRTGESIVKRGDNAFITWLKGTAIGACPMPVKGKPATCTTRPPAQETVANRVRTIVTQHAP